MRPSTTVFQSVFRIHGAAFAALTLPVFLFHIDILLFGEWIGGGDLINQFVPWREFALSELAAGRFPAWNPHLFSGTPFAANIQTSLFYPENLLHLIMPTESVFSWSLAFHHLMAALAMYAFLYSLTDTSPAAAFGAIVYAWSGFFITHAHDGHLIHARAYAWIPLALLAQGAGTGFSLRRAAALGLCLAMMFYAGHTQIPLYIFYLLIARAVWQSAWRWRSGETQGAVLAGAGTTAAGIALSMGLSALVLWPLAHLSGLTAGRAGGADYAFATSDSMPPAFLASFIAPFFFGDPTAGAREAQFWLTRTGYHELSGYIGVFGLLICLFAALPRHNHAQQKMAPLQTGFFALIAALALAFALGKYNPLYPILYYGLPGWSFFRVPARLVMIFIIGASVVSAMGLKRWIDNDRTRLADAWPVKTAILASAGIAIITLIAALSEPALRAWLREFEINRTVFEMELWTVNRADISARLPEALFAIRYSYIRDSLIVACGWLGLGWLSLVMMKLRSANWLRWAPALVLTFELLWFSHRFIESYPPREWQARFYPESDIARAIESASGDGRALLLDDALGYPGIEYHPELRPNRLMRYGVDTARGYDPLILQRYADFANVIYGKAPGTPQGGLLFFAQAPPESAIDQLAANALVTTQNPGDGWREAWRSPASPVAVYQSIRDRPMLYHSDADAVCSIEIINNEPGGLSAHVTSDRPGQIIWSQTFHPNWQAFVNGHATQTLENNNTWLAIEIAEGESTIEFIFQPLQFYYGGVASLGVLVMLCFGLLKIRP